MKWIEFKEGNKLPKEKRYVLLQLNKSLDAGMSSVVVGYLKFAAGDKSCPYFVLPGVAMDTSHNRREVTHWSDCLGDDFYAPLWKGTQS